MHRRSESAPIHRNPLPSVAHKFRWTGADSLGEWVPAVTGCADRELGMGRRCGGAPGLL